MNPRAIIFDVYQTLLDVGPPPADAETLWHTLFADFGLPAPPFSLEGFQTAVKRVIARQHAEARAAGVPWPEIQWPNVVTEVMPAVAGLPDNHRDDFIFREIQLHRSLRLADHAATCLATAHGRNILLGIASNAQAYTIRELAGALATAGLDLSWFESDLRFWSHEHGFSKPDPHVFRILTARLAARGIAPDEILMVGDREDNDIRPAAAHGWPTWQLAPGKGTVTPGGSLADLARALRHVC